MDDSIEKPIPLSQAPNQKPLKVVQIRAGQVLSARIAAVGIQPGSVMQVRRIGPSFCLARVGRSRQSVSLGVKVAGKIWVTHK